MNHRYSQGGAASSDFRYAHRDSLRLRPAGLHGLGIIWPEDNCNWGGLRLHGAKVMLNTAHEADERLPVPDPARTASHADACLFFGCEDLDAAYRHLRVNGVNLKPRRGAPYGMRQLAFAARVQRPRRLWPVLFSGHAGEARSMGGRLRHQAQDFRLIKSPPGSGVTSDPGTRATAPSPSATRPPRSNIAPNRGE
jgi:hypothetical protein